jgi:DNA-binding CsgD family transcriptional regulator
VGDYACCATTGTAGPEATWAEVVPHLERAASIALDQARTKWHRSQLECDADCVPSGRIVLDARLRVLYVNRSARAMAAMGDAFAISYEHLEPRRATDRSLLVEAMSELDRGREEPFVVTLPRCSGRWPYLVRLTVLRKGVRALYELVLIDRDPGEGECDSLMLAGLGLTRAEARVVSLLIEGRSSEEIAVQGGIARGTAKLHVQHAMAKLGVRRRSELLRRVLAPWVAAMPAWPRGDGVEGASELSTAAVHWTRLENRRSAAARASLK